MRLEWLEGLPSFALLGPGFGGSLRRRSYTLLKGLRAVGASAKGVRLAYAGFETPGSRPRIYAAESVLHWGPLSPAPASPPGAGAPGAAPLGPVVRLRARAHASKIARIRRDIARGDVYQVCLCARAELAGPDGSGLLALMARAGKPRFCAWVRLPGGPEFVSASPELFFETRGSRVHSQPMKGTAARGRGACLSASAKDAAELAMITDLVRNDLTPVCAPGSVRVARARRQLRLAYAVQSVSDIEGRLAPGAGPLDVLKALHPGGSVTGAPKEAALKRIRSLEDGPRGAYCGALGLLKGGAKEGDSVFSLLIRTAQKRREGWVYGVGEGIVYDSDAAAERAELDVKLGALTWPTRR